MSSHGVSMGAPVAWLHGERVVVVPVAMARRAVAAIPECRPRYFAEDGHFSVLSNHLAWVLEGGASSPR